MHAVVLQRRAAHGRAGDDAMQVDDADTVAVRLRHLADEDVQVVDTPGIERGAELVGPVHDVPVVVVRHRREREPRAVTGDDVDRGLEIRPEQRVRLRRRERHPSAVDATVVGIPRPDEEERHVGVELRDRRGPGERPPPAVVADR